MMLEAPQKIRSLRDAGVLEVAWRDGRVFQLPFTFLRGRCPCASCVDEFSGRRVLDADSLPDTIQPVDITFTGNYALKIVWSDRHDTGLYSWDYLAELCTAEEAQRVDPT